MARGKKGVDRNEQVDMLTYLATVAKGPVQKMDVLIQVRVVRWLLSMCSADQSSWVDGDSPATELPRRWLSPLLVLFRLLEVFAFPELLLLLLL